MEDRVRCRICGKLFRQITNTHLKLHGTTIKWYRDTYPNADLLSTKLLEQKRLAGVASQQSDIVRERICSQENVERLQRQARAAGKSVQRSPKMQKYWDRLRRNAKERLQHKVVYREKNGVQCQLCGKWFMRVTNTHLTKVHNMTMREYMDIFPNNSINSDEYRDKNLASLYKYLSSDECSELRSIQAKSRWCDPMYRQSQAESIARANAEKKYTDIERILYGILDHLNLSYQKQVPIDGYIVDALVENWLILEAYGDYWHGPDRPEQQKRDSIRTDSLEFLGFQVVPIWGHELREQTNSWKTRIGYMVDCT